MKRASYRFAIAWIAMNDEADCDEALVPERVAELVTSGLVADLFEVDVARVGRDVVRCRLDEAQREATAAWARTGVRP